MGLGFFLFLFFLISFKTAFTQEEQSRITLTGGISTSLLYSNSTDRLDTVITNLYFRLSGKEEKLRFGVGIGDVVAPSVIDKDYSLYPEVRLYDGAVFLDSPVILQIGLLEPLEGYENNQTYLNPNILSSAVSSIEPFNAYGFRAGYGFEKFTFYAGYYTDRLERDEYCYREICSTESYNLVVERNGENSYFFLSFYNLKDFYNIFNIILTRHFGNLEISLDGDYAFWDGSARDSIRLKYGENLTDHAYGVSLYIIPKYKIYRFPVRIEYINQDKSQIYVQNRKTREIYSLSFTPTVREENYLFRFELGFTKAENFFSTPLFYAGIEAVYML
ncbi:MAG: outer membrane beta-barrel protein [Aquificae bacterium]|nr:outer membrane beta-barrel protein [Aquificota bacterium]